jgi:hypothetical protein
VPPLSREPLGLGCSSMDRTGRGLGCSSAYLPGWVVDRRTGWAGVVGWVIDLA